MRHDFAPLVGRLFVAMLLVASTACVAPFSEMQSARLAGRGVVEITPSYSTVEGPDNGESVKIQDNFGVAIATGISNRMDLRARIEHLKVDERDPAIDYGTTVFGFGPKLSLLPDQLALYVPVGFAFGGGISQSDSWQLHPALIWTIPVSDMVEVNSSVKALIPLSDNNDVFAAINVGLGIGPDLSRWAIRPEFGILKNPGDSRTVRHFSIGAAFYIGRK